MHGIGVARDIALLYIAFAPSIRMYSLLLLIRRDKERLAPTVGLRYCVSHSWLVFQDKLRTSLQVGDMKTVSYV